MLEALATGESDAEALAELARGSLRKKIPQLQKALTGLAQPHHRFLIEQILGHIDYLEEAIAKVQREIEQRLEENAEEVELLQSIPAIKANAAASIIAEIGTDRSRFLLTPSISPHGREFVQGTNRVRANGSRRVSAPAIPIYERF